MDVKLSLPLLPLRDIVVFPSMVIPLFVGRDKSISALNEVMKNEKKIILVTQKNSEIDDPKKTDIFMYGCEGSILQLLKLPDGTVKVLVEGIRRVKILDFKDNEKFITCDFAAYSDLINKDEDLFPLAVTAVRRLEKLTSINKKISSETINTIKQLKEETDCAANILGVDELHYLSFKDLKVPFSYESVSQLERVIKQCKADIIYTHWSGDSNQDHIATFKTTMAAARYVPNIYCYEQIPIPRHTDNPMRINSISIAPTPTIIPNTKPRSTLRKESHICPVGTGILNKLNSPVTKFKTLLLKFDFISPCSLCTG